MFVRYLGGGIGHGDNAARIETLTEPDNDPNDGLDNQPDDGLSGSGGEDNEGSEDEEDPDRERVEYSEGDTESGDDEEPNTTL
jgi:hypothetical protein